MPKPKGKVKGKWIPPWVKDKEEEDKKASAKKTKAKASKKK